MKQFPSAPLLDHVRCTTAYKDIVNQQQLLGIIKYCKNAGLKIGRISKRQNAIKRFVTIDYIPSVGFRVASSIDTNGFIWAKERLEPETLKDPKCVGQHRDRNFFFHSNIYRDSEQILKSQYSWLNEEEAFVSDVFKAALAYVGLQPSVTRRFNHVEITCDIPTGREDSITIMNGLIKAQRIGVPYINLSEVNEKGGVKGAVSEFIEGDKLSVYLKYGRPRIENRCGEDFFKKFQKLNPAEGCPVSDGLTSVVRHASQRFKSLSRCYAHPTRLSTIDALAAVLVCCERVEDTFPEILRRLAVGCGRLRVTSTADRAVYRSVNELKKQGIVRRGKWQSEYVLNDKYRELLKFDTTSNVLTDITSEKSWLKFRSIAPQVLEKFGQAD